MDKVGPILREVAAAEVLPHFRNLADHQIHEKNKGDIVTSVDLAVERVLTPRLAELVKGSLVLGEESVHKNEGLLDHFATDEFVWVIDPIDGTRAFAKGKEGFCIIVALTRHGETVGGWIYQPTSERLVTAEKGAGAWDGGARLSTAARPLEEARGALHLHYLPKHLRDQMKAGITSMASNTPVSSAGLEYLRIASGETDVSMFWNSYPWDHAAGALIVEEAGGHVGFKNGIAYAPGVKGLKGILASGMPDQWQYWCDLLFNEERWARE